MPKKRNNHAPSLAAEIDELQRLAAQQAAPPPAILDLNACRIQITDVQTPEGAQKLVTFVHLTGGFIAKTMLPTSMARDVATMLSTPPGIIIPTDTPTPDA